MNKIMSLPELNKFISHKIDLFICSASFEQRCIKVAEYIKNNISNSLIFYINDQSSMLGENLEKIEGHLSNNRLSVKLLPDSPLQNADLFIEHLEHAINGKINLNVLVDITTFTKENLLIFYYILRHYSKQFDALNFVYTNAKDYSVGDPAKDKWLSKGVKNIRSILGYSGTFLPSQKLHLVIMVGFEIERVTKIIDILEPDLLSLGMAGETEGTDLIHFAANEFALKSINNAYAGKISYFKFSCKDPLLTKKSLEEEVNKYRGFNVSIAPLNNKVSAVGAALLCFSMPEIQLCYASPNIYNTNNYSYSSDDCIVLDNLI